MKNLLLFLCACGIAVAQQSGYGNYPFSTPPNLSLIGANHNNGASATSVVITPATGTNGGSIPGSAAQMKDNILSGTYTSGGSVTGSSGQTCVLSAFNGSGYSAIATVALTGTNTIAGSTALTIVSAGGGFTSAPTSATFSNGTATCSGTPTISTTLGIANNNTLVAMVKMDGNSSETVTWPSGFSQIYPASGSTCSTSGNKTCMAVATKTASSESGTYTISWGTSSGFFDAIILNVPGVSNTVDGTVTSAAADAASLTIPSTTPLKANGLWLVIATQVESSGGTPANPYYSLTNLDNKDYLSVFAMPWGGSSTGATTVQFYTSSTVSTTQDAVAFQFVLPSNGTTNTLPPVNAASPANPGYLYVPGAGAGFGASYVGGVLETNGLLVDAFPNGSATTFMGGQLSFRSAPGVPVSFVQLNSANDFHMCVNGDCNHMFVGSAARGFTGLAAGIQFVVSSGRYGYITNDGAEDATFFYPSFTQTITSLTAANPTVLTLSHQYPTGGTDIVAGATVTITGAAGTGCTGLNATWLVSAVSGNTITVPFNATSCSYTASSGVIGSSGVAGQNDLHLGANGLDSGNAESTNNYYDVQSTFQHIFTVNDLPVAFVDAQGIHGVQNKNHIQLLGNATCSTGCTSLATITDGTYPWSWTFTAVQQRNYSIECHGSYSQATAAAANAFGVQASTTAPTNIYARMKVMTSSSVTTDVTLPTLSSTTATNIGTFTPSAAGTIGTVADIFGFDLYITVQMGAGATTVNIMDLTGSSSDALTIYQGSYCELLP